MNRKKIIGIPIKNLENPMSRLSEILTQEERIHTQKELIRNIVQSFKNNDHETYLISTDNEVEILAKNLNVKIFKSNSSGLNKEVIEFSKLFSNYDAILITDMKDASKKYTELTKIVDKDKVILPGILKNYRRGS